MFVARPDIQMNVKRLVPIAAGDRQELLPPDPDRSVIESPIVPPDEPPIEPPLIVPPIGPPLIEPPPIVPPLIEPPPIAPPPTARLERLP